MPQLIAWLPGLLFLVTLWLMDTFKLVRRESILIALAYGGAAALACEQLHEWLVAATALDVDPLSRYVAPLTEETAKTLFVAVLIARGRIGFLVDAAVIGFAVGTGFAIAENAIYIRTLESAPLLLWVFRGLGAGVLHGTTAAIAAIAAKSIHDRSPGQVFWFLPGWALAVVIHSAYNHLLVAPMLAAALVLIGLPLIVVAVFERSEQSTREWVGAGLDLDLELLQLLTSDQVHVTRFGRYLRDLQSHVAGPVIADMLCLLRLELELAVQAKARLIAQEAGLEIPVDQDLHDSLAEWEYLRRSIGPAGLLALEPLRLTSHRDDWHRHVLSQAGLRQRLRGIVNKRLIR
jgi:RsiW-degrading membrane proteinase PrsW (M82 family)